MKTFKANGRRGFARLLPVVMVVVGMALIGHFLVGGRAPASAEAPADTAMRLTVPEMARVENVPVYEGAANDEAALDRGALHVNRTGFPWQPGANVYIAGHRLGFGGSGSHLLFYDLHRLENGDEILLTDADGTRYTYRVFRSLTARPEQVEVMQPFPGRSIVSLQTCTLPDYSERLIVQGELVGVN